MKWSLHAREEIVFELLQHLKGNGARSLLEGIKKSTREMIEEQEAVRGRLFTIQDVMQSTVRAWLQVPMLQNLHLEHFSYFQTVARTTLFYIPYIYMTIILHLLNIYPG